MYDVHIKNGLTVEDEKIEVAIKDGKIVDVSEKLDIEVADKIIDLNYKSYVTAGWIDAHTHCFENNELYGDEPDKVGYPNGVTTVIDAGTTGSDRVEEFYKLSKIAKTNVYALLNISKVGIVKQDELSNLAKIDAKSVQETITKFPDFIVGIKARMSESVVGKNGILPLKKAKEIQKENNDIPLMVHIGSAPPKLNEILNILEKGDIVTHCYNGKANNIFGESSSVQDFVWEAYNRGVLFDIGHGTDSFNFNTAKKAIKDNFIDYSISTDIYRKNRINGPVYDFPTTIEKMLSLDFSLTEILPMITTHPAEMFNLDKKGKIEKDFDADLTIFNIKKNNNKILVDSNGNNRKSKYVVNPTDTIIGGTVYHLGV